MKEYNAIERRQANLRQLKDLINEYENIEKSYSKLKRDTLVEIETQNLDENEKNNKINAAFEEIDNTILEDKKTKERKIKKAIKKQAALMTLIEKDEDVYKYFKLVNENPLEGEFGELESNLYHEFLLHGNNEMLDSGELSLKGELKYNFRKRTFSDVRNIIIAYSELEELKGQNLESDLNSKQSEETEEKSEETEEKSEETEEKSEETEEKSEETEEKENVKEIETDDKDFVKLLEKLENDLSEGIDLEEKLVKALVSMFDKLETEEKINYTIRVKNIVNEYNIEQQNSYRKHISKEKPEKYNLKTRLLEFFGAPAKLFLNSKLGKVMYNSMLDKAKNNENSEKEEIIKDKIGDRDIVSGPIFYANKNKLSHLKFKLYKNNEILSNKEDKTLHSKIIRVSKSLSKGLERRIKRDESEILEDKKRTLNIIKQYLEELSIDPDSYEKEKQLEDFILNAASMNTISNNEANMFKQEISNLVKYRNKKDTIYEIDNSEFEKASEYEKNPVKGYYMDEDLIKPTQIPFVKRKY